MAATKNQRTILAATSITTSGGAISGTASSQTTAYGGQLIVRFTNGASAPTVAPSCTVNVSGDNTTYYTQATVYGDTTASSTNDYVIDIGPGIQYVNVTFAQATTNAYTGSAYFEELTTV